MKYHSPAQRAAVMAHERTPAAPGIYRPMGTTGSPLKMAAMLHIKQPRGPQPSPIPGIPKPPSTPTY